MPKDLITSLLFNQNVTFTYPEQFSLGGYLIDTKMAALLTGAPDFSQIKMTLLRERDDPDSKAIRADFTVRNGLFLRPAEFAVVSVDAGYACLMTNYLVLHPEHTNLGYGIRIFAHQAYTADLLGISQIWLDAVGGGSDSIYNGSYSWARYGFEPYFTLDQQEMFAERFPGVKDLPELMSTSKGRAAWRARGFSAMMCFDLLDDQCWSRLEAYMLHKGVAIS